MAQHCDLIIRLGATSIEAVRVTRDGPGASAVRVLPEGFDLSIEVSRELSGLDGVLSEVLAELGVSHGRVSVLYSSTDTAAILHSVPTDPAEALVAAELATSEQVSFSLMANPSRHFVLGSQQATEQNEMPATVVLAVADRDEMVDALAAWVVRHGLRVSSILPVTAPAWRDIWERLAGFEADGPVAYVHLGNDRMLIAGGSGGRLAFSRTINIGSDQLVGAAATACDAQDDLLGIAKALWGGGIPSRNQSFPWGGGVEGSQVLPALQPVLQRFAVELRQTLRFGFGEREMSRASVVLLGPGASIPNLADAFSAQLEAPVAPAPDAGVYAPSTPAARGSEIALVLETQVAPISLMSERMTRMQQNRSLRNWLRVGAAAAALILTADFASTSATVSESRAALTSATDDLKALRVDDDRWLEAADRAAELTAVKRTIYDAFGYEVAWGAVLAELSRKTSDEVRITEVIGSAEKSGSSLTLRGLAEEQSGALSGFVSELANSPAIASVNLASTRAAVRDGREIQRFELHVELVGTRLDGSRLGRPLVGRARADASAGEMP